MGALLPQQQSEGIGGGNWKTKGYSLGNANHMTFLLKALIIFHISWLLKYIPNLLQYCIAQGGGEENSGVAGS